jgi:hypothetical protein
MSTNVRLAYNLALLDKKTPQELKHLLIKEHRRIERHEQDQNLVRITDRWAEKVLDAVQISHEFRLAGNVMWQKKGKWRGKWDKNSQQLEDPRQEPHLQRSPLREFKGNSARTMRPHSASHAPVRAGQATKRMSVEAVGQAHSSSPLASPLRSQGTGNLLLCQITCQGISTG